MTDLSASNVIAFESAAGASRPPVPMTGNLPPKVAAAFDPEYRGAMADVLDKWSPMDLIGAHQFLGSEADRAAGAQFVSRRLSTPPDPARVVVTNSTQSILTMLLGGLAGPQATIAVEELTYPTLAVFARLIGFKLAAVRMDEDGILPDSFEHVCRTAKPKFLYTLPCLQNPTTATLPLERRNAIVAVARKYGVAIVEDDIYSLLPPELPPPLAELAPEITWYTLGTAKSIAAGLKVAYLVAPSAREVTTQFWPGVAATYWMVAPANAAIASTFIRNGAMDRIITATRVETRFRQEMVAKTLKGASYRATPESLHVWLELPKDKERRQFVTECKAKGAEVGPSDTFLIAGGVAPHRIRFGTGKAETRVELQRGLDAIASAFSD